MAVLRLISMVLPVLPSACRTDSDCSLLGDCIDSVCRCDAGWTGPKCGQVDLLPVKRDWGYHNESMSSWCGSAIKVHNEYHYFGSGMSGHCALKQFPTNSMSVRGTSKSPTGPYEFEQVALPEFSHSTSIKRDIDGSFLLFSIGKDMKGQDVHTCDGEGPWNSTRGDSDFPNLGAHDFVRISKSASPYGPWETRNILQTDPSTPHKWDCNKSNPSAVVLKNGSILMMYRGEYCPWGWCPPGTGEAGCQHQGIAFAENSSAPFVDRQGAITELDENEDAFFWQSRRGFHALFHSKAVCNAYDEMKSCGSLAYSPDSWHWTVNEDAAYNASVVWEEPDGSLTPDKLLSRQRPNILFAENGTPLVLWNGVQISSSIYEYSMAAPFNVGNSAQQAVSNIV